MQSICNNEKLFHYDYFIPMKSLYIWCANTKRILNDLKLWNNLLLSVFDRHLQLLPTVYFVSLHWMHLKETTFPTVEIEYAIQINKSRRNSLFSLFYLEIHQLFMFVIFESC